MHGHDEGSVAKGLDKKVDQLLLFCPFHSFSYFALFLLLLLVVLQLRVLILFCRCYNLRMKTRNTLTMTGL